MKGIVLIMDGMGDRPIKELNNQTPLQAANTPNMDGVDVLPGDIAFRCNFSTADENLIVTDRRAGRIKEGTKDIVEVLNTMVLDDYPDVKIIFKESTGHRAVLVLRGEGLSDKVSDADPKVEGNKPKEVKALDESKEAAKTADILNQLVNKSYEMIKDHPVNVKRIEEGKPPANIIIPRGAGEVPVVDSLNEKYEVKNMKSTLHVLPKQVLLWESADLQEWILLKWKM